MKRSNPDGIMKKRYQKALEDLKHGQLSPEEADAVLRAAPSEVLKSLLEDAGVDAEHASARAIALFGQRGKLAVASAGSQRDEALSTAGAAAVDSERAERRITSRIGSKKVAIPADVVVTIEGQTVFAVGPKGSLSWTLAEEMQISQTESELMVSPRVDSKRAQAMWGLSRTLLANMIQGVTTGFEESLELVGVGYRAAMKGTTLSLQLGLGENVELEAPPGVSFAVPKDGQIKILGADKQAVLEIAAKIRRIRPPEPYKGKGIRYAGRKVRRGEAK